MAARIDGLQLYDANRAVYVPGILFFKDPTGPAGAERPFPSRLTERLEARDLTAVRGLTLRISENAELAAAVTVTTEP